MSVWTFAKLLHIFAGVFWIGAAVIISLFVVPAVKATGPSGGAVMKQLTVAQKLPIWINLAAFLTVICGIGMYQHQLGGFKILPMDTLYGAGLTIGTLSGLAAFLWGALVQGPTAKKLGGIASQLQGPPTPEQQSAMNALQARLHRGGIIGVTLLVISLAGMILTHPL